MTSALFTPLAPTQEAPSPGGRMGPGRGIPSGTGTCHLSQGPPTHQGVVEDLPEVRVQVVRVIPGGGQEAAKFVLIAEVEEDALAVGRGCEEGDGEPAGCLPVTPPGAPGPLTLSRRLLQKAMSGSVSLPENTSRWGSSVLRVSPRIT